MADEEGKVIDFPAQVQPLNVKDEMTFEEAWAWAIEHGYVTE